MVYTQILMGIIGGLAYSLSGLAKIKKRENFDWKKMLPTLTIAGIVGGIAGFTGQDFGIVESSTMAVTVTAVVENLYKAVYRKYFA